MNEFLNSETEKILSNLSNEDFCLEDLIASSNMSRNSYLITFKKTFGISPIAFINKLRMQRAGELILSTSKTIKEISYECGFADYHYFCRCFKKFFHMTTTEYRLAHG